MRRLFRRQSRVFDLPHALQALRREVKTGRNLPVPARKRPGDWGGWMFAATLDSSAMEGQRSRFAISFDLEMRWSLHLSLKLMASPRELYDAMQPTISQTTSKPVSYTHLTLPTTILV